MDYLKIATRVILEESKALSNLAQNVSSDFQKLVEYILQIKGKVILTGVGKSGHIAKKISSSLASTGTPSIFIHSGEASHGDLGMVTENDIVIILSNSGETREVFDIMNYCKRYNIKIAALTMNVKSTIAANCDFLLNLPQQKEVSTIPAPTTSALMTLALGDALVVALHESKGFSEADFAIFHPGGRIGANLLKIHQLMRQNNELPIVKNNTNFTELVKTITIKKLGCAIVIGNSSEILGIITDGDLRRHINDDGLVDKTTMDIMTTNPITINENKSASEALYIMNNKSISILPVVSDNKLVGIVHIYDILRAGVV